MSDLVFRSELIYPLSVDFLSETAKNLVETWDFTRNENGVFNGLVSNIDFTPPFDGYDASNTLISDETGARIEGVFSQATGLSDVNKRTLNSAPYSSFILQLDLKTGTSGNNGDVCLKISPSDTRSSFGIYVRRQNGVYVNVNYRGGVRTETGSVNIGAQIDGVITVVGQIYANSSSTVTVYLNGIQVYQSVSSYSQFFANSWNIYQQGLGATSANSRMRHQAVYIKQGDIFTDDEINDVLHNPYSIFKTREDIQQEYCLKLTSSSHILTINFTGNYDIDVTDTDDVVTNYTGTGTFTITGATEIAIATIRGTHDDGYELFDFNQTSGTTVKSLTSDLLCSVFDNFYLVTERYIFTNNDYATIDLFNAQQNQYSDSIRGLIINQDIAGGTLDNFAGGCEITSTENQKITSNLTISTTGFTNIHDIKLSDVDATNATNVHITNYEADNVTG